MIANKVRPALLLVDDSADLRRALVRGLRVAFEVTALADAEAALALLAHESFAIVLTDQEMPGATGVWLLEQIRTRFPHMRRFLMSGLEEGDIAGLEVAEGFFRKPVAPRAMVALLLVPRAQ
jgi:DNA-binding NtrC family response regulator